MIKPRFPNSFLFSSSMLLLGISSYSFAIQSQPNDNGSEEDIERIVVTADLAARDLSELPGTALVLSAQAIEARQARHFEDLVSVAPNLNFSSGASRGRFIQIRGIGERSQFAEPINPSIGILLDDIDISGIGGLATVHDLAQVEILSGPQSVASGINSIGGIVKLVSRSSTPDSYVNVNASYAQFNESRVAAVYSNGLSDNLQARFAIQNTQSDGFVENAFLSRSDTNGVDETTIKALFDYSISSNTSLNINLYHFDIDNNYDAFSLDNNNVTQSDMPGFDEVDASAASAKLSHQFDNHTLQITSFYLKADTAYGYDEDWTHPGFHPDGYSSVDAYDREISRKGIDLKFANKKRKDINQYLIGANFTSSEEDLVRQNTFLDGIYINNYQPDSHSVFGQYQWKISSTLNLTGAFRGEEFSADFSDSIGDTTVEDTLLAASIAADYKIGDTLLFANVSRGYKAAGFNIDPRLAVDNRSFKAETNYSYELGVKGRTLDGLANINLTFFYMDRDDAQISDSLVVQIDGSDASSFIDGIGNADTGINKGIEVSSSIDMSDDWYIQANLGYLDATFGNYFKLNGDFVPTQEQAHAPKRTAYLASNWQISNAFNWFVDLEYKDDFRLGVNHDVRAPSTALVNSELRYQHQGEHLYSVKLWVKNLTDRQVITRGFGSFPNDPRDGYSSNGPYFQLGQERQFGVSFEYEWY